MFPVGNPTNPVPPVTPTRAELDDVIRYYNDGTLRCSNLAVFLAAARAYREGLPAVTKTVWHVSDAEGSVHYDTLHEAIEAARLQLVRPVSDVTIGRRTVPA